MGRQDGGRKRRCDGEVGCCRGLELLLSKQWLLDELLLALCPCRGGVLVVNGIRSIHLVSFEDNTGRIPC